MSLIGKIIHAFIERGAGRLSINEIKTKLTETEAVITDRILKAADTPKNRDMASHLIGIERWAQKRLSVTVGEPLVIEEYDAYRPGTLHDSLFPKNNTSARNTCPRNHKSSQHR